MGSLQERLAAREQAAVREVEDLRARVTQLSAQLAQAEENLQRVRDAAELLTEVLAEDIDQVVPAASSAPAVGLPRDLRRWQTVPHRAQDADLATLPGAYRDVLEVMQDAGRAVRCKEVCAALGLASSDGAREAMRGKLLRLVARGWCVQGEPGRFALAPGVCGRMP